MIEAIGQISNVGWGVIAFVALLIFIVLMSLIFKGVKFNLKNKSLSVGNKEEIDNQIGSKLEAFKKEIEKKDLERLHDEEHRKSLFKRSMKIDEHLMADMRQSVRRIDKAVSDIFSPYFSSSLPVSLVSALIKDELNERLDYNNVKDKLSKRERGEYCEDILKDIRDKYSTFYLQATKLPSEDEYPEWEAIESDITSLIKGWETKIVSFLCSHIKKKIELYECERNNFKTEAYKENSITYPIEKNKNYLKDLGGGF